MEITSFKKIDKISDYLKALINSEKTLLGGYSKFRIPSPEEINYYNDNISQKLIQNIEKHKSSNMLLIRSQVVAGMNYNAIISVTVNGMSNLIKKEYYEINYFVPLY